MDALWFFDHGIGVFPIRDASKEPACQSWDDYSCPRDQVAKFRNYGVRLGPCRGGFLGVIDPDNLEAIAWAERNVPDTNAIVTTGRGVHLYFRLAGRVPKFLHRDGLTIELRNEGQYVVGPGSIHPSGRRYDVVGLWPSTFAEIPQLSATFQFDDRPIGVIASGEGFELPDAVYAGERHDVLFKWLRSLKALGHTLETVREMVSLANQEICKPPVQEDSTFRRWVERGWNNPDRPLVTTGVTYKRDDMGFGL